MSFPKSLAPLFIFVTFLLAPVVNGQINPQTTKITEPPIKCIVLKHPAANDAATFFATSTAISFEVYKPGNMKKILAELAKDPEVENAKAGTVTGDYHQVTLSVKTTKDKMWYVSLFKKAGLNNIKINNNPVVEVDKM